MTPFEIAFGIIVLLGLGLTVLLQLRRSPSSAPDLSAEVASLRKELDQEKRERNELAGKGKELFSQFKNLESEYKATIKERDGLQKTITKFETSAEHREKEHRDMVQKLENAERALEKERQRVIKDEERARTAADAERDRLWNDHENTVIALLSDLCKQPHLQFTTYSNNKLPDDFDGSLKPDFLIDFLGQYVIFDAKVSKAQSLQTYIDEQVKKTAAKIKKNDQIYPHVFLVVPTEAISELKKLIFPVDQYYFYVVSQEALAPILSSLKRISTYELAETLDPQKRENIINMLAELATHISYRNAHELILTKMGAETLERVARTDPSLAAEVDQKRSEKKLAALAPSDIKRIAQSLTEQNAEIASLAAPKASIGKNMIEAAEKAMSQKLL
ncbi:MAG: hypothetical protein ABL890_01880 [Candidatus Peribacteraceae bacterium]